MFDIGIKILSFDVREIYMYWERFQSEQTLNIDLLLRWVFLPLKIHCTFRTTLVINFIFSIAVSVFSSFSCSLLLLPLLFLLMIYYIHFEHMTLFLFLPGHPDNSGLSSDSSVQSL